jgi:hypothetical protein
VMLLQRLITLLPHQSGSAVAMIVVLIGGLAGLALWIAGARFSQSILTLAAVALGTAIGMKLPTWCNWSIDPMAPAIVGAIVLGISAYAFHRAWVALWLGAILALWSALIFWAMRGTEFHWRWPRYDATQALSQYFTDLWQNVPESLHQCLAVGAAAALLVGISAVWLWPRVGVSLLWSAIGVTLLLPTAATALSKFDPEALRHLPRENSSQLAMLAGLIAAGAILQWRTISLLQAAGAGDPSGNASKKKSKDSSPAD